MAKHFNVYQDWHGVLLAAADIVAKYSALGVGNQSYAEIAAERDDLRARVAGLEEQLSRRIADLVSARVERTIYHRYKKEADTLAAENRELRDAAQAVIERWESPAWRDSEPTAAVIYRLRDILWPNDQMRDG